ncbi:MAG: carbonic anhydrase [Rhabdochlamydiaceae bacterium]|nr:carbonic anhydrase [Rhabdochlamydiaceae bacterium]
MYKLIKGILEFRRKYLQYYRDHFGHLAEGQSPDALLITCCDSRVAPNAFASTNPGDVFVMRNVGNIVPTFESLLTHTGTSEAATIEFSLHYLPVKDIIVCGHSDCGAMRALMAGAESIQDPHLRQWLKHCGCDGTQKECVPGVDCSLAPHNQLAQKNVLQQLLHLKTYPLVQQRLQEGTLNLHAWYFDLAKGDIYSYEEEFQRFVLIDEEEAQRILKRLK